MRYHNGKKTGRKNVVEQIVGLFFLAGYVPTFLSAQTVCVPHVAGGAVTINGSATGDWDTFSSLNIDYNDISGNFSTKLVTDDTYL